MPRSVGLMLIFLSLAFPVARATDIASSAAQRTTAEEIVAGNVLARGGSAAWRAVKSIRMTGRMDAGLGLEVPFHLELERPRKMRLELVFQDETAVQAYDGTVGWKLRPFLGRKGVEALSEEELRSAAAQADLDGPLIDYAAKGYKVELVGREPVEGHDAYELKLTLAGREVSHIWVDARTLLEIKLESTRRLHGTDRRVATYYRNYAPVAGLLMPHLLETAVEGIPQKSKLTIETVVLNPAIADSRFTRP